MNFCLAKCVCEITAQKQNEVAGRGKSFAHELNGCEKRQKKKFVLKNYAHAFNDFFIVKLYFYSGFFPSTKNVLNFSCKSAPVVIIPLHIIDLQFISKRISFTKTNKSFAMKIY